MKKYFILFIYLLCNYGIEAGFRDLLILIDWQNERVLTNLQNVTPLFNPTRISGFGPVSSGLVTGLAQKVPMLISSSLWKNFVERKQIFTDFISLSDEALIKKYKGVYPKFNTDEEIKNFAYLCKETIKANSSYIFRLIKTNYAAISEIKGFMLPYLTKVDSNEWFMQKITDHWYLLMPNAYFEQIKKESFLARTANIAAQISDDELKLGVKFGQPLQDPFDYTKHDDNLMVDYQQELFRALKRLFITINDVKDPSSKEKTEENITKYLHDWYFYLHGHGGPSSLGIKGVIAGLTIDRFQELLTFFNNKIKTDFLFYSTCYAGGQHLKTPFVKTWYYPLLKPTLHKFKATRAESFNYVISAETLVYAATFGWLPSIPLPFRIGNSTITYLQHFPIFFKEIKEYMHPQEINLKQWLAQSAAEKKKKYPNLARILNYITIFLKPNGEIDEKMQIPVVRYPNTGWFSVIDASKNIFRLTTILAQTHAAEQREIVIKDKEALILYAESPFTEKKVDPDYHNEVLASVRIKKEKVIKSPTVLSNAPGNALHYFEQIIAPTSSIIELLNSFIPPINELYSRYYYIKKLVCKNDIRSNNQNKALTMNLGESIELENIIILYNARNPLDKQDQRKLNGVFFTHQLTNFYSFWEPTDMQKIDRLKKIEFPGLAKITESNFVPPQYPYPLPENRLKVIADLLEKKLKEQKGSKGVLMQLQQELVSLTQSFEQLNKVLGLT